LVRRVVDRRYNGGVDGGSPPRRSARSALIVATANYLDPGLRALRGAASDADALREVLADPAVGEFDVATVLDRPAHEVAEELEGFFADRLPGDLLLVHLSGHGIKNQTGELHFAMTNTKLDRLAATSVTAEFLNRQMGASRARSIILCLDCCYAGAFDRGMVPRATESVDLGGRFSGQGRAVITASGALEYAFEGGALTHDGRPQPSVFTTAMVEGLSTGAADRDRDGWVGLGELYEYVHDAVRSANPNQTPGMWAFGIQGNLVVARRSGAAVGPGTEIGAATDEATTVADEHPPHRPVLEGPAAKIGGQARVDARRSRLETARRAVTWRRATLAVAIAAVAVLVGLFSVPVLRGEGNSGIHEVPAGFEGTWAGDATVRDNGVAHLTITLVQGDTDLTLDSTGAPGNGHECLDGALTLTGATASQITTSFTPHNGDCARGTVKMDLVDDQLRYHFHADDGARGASAVLTQQ
jgi:Caspase domain